MKNIQSHLARIMEEIEKEIDWIESNSTLSGYSAYGDKNYILNIIASSHQSLLETIYNHLVSEEVRIAKDRINSDYENGYFEAIDDIAKYIASLKSE